MAKYEPKYLRQKTLLDGWVVEHFDQQTGDSHAVS